MIKGIVHPKNTVIIHWMLVTKQLSVAIDFHIMGENTMEANGYHHLFIDQLS